MNLRRGFMRLAMLSHLPFYVIEYAKAHAECRWTHSTIPGADKLGISPARLSGLSSFL